MTLLQLGIRNEYRARVWQFEGTWWVAIETPNAVGGWYRVALDVGGKWWEEAYNITALSFGSETAARAKAQSLLSELRASHAMHEAPLMAAKTAEVIT